MYWRKYVHDFKVALNDDNLEGSKGLEFISKRTFLVSKVNHILMYDSNTF